MKSLWLYLLLACPLAAYAQYHELGLMVSTSSYSGELTPYNTLPTAFSPGGGLVYRYNFNDRLALKANVLYNRFWGDDSESDEAWRRNRNLQFRTDLFEFAAQLEVNFFTYEIGDRRRPSTPYLFAGLALYRFNPQAEINDRWVELQPLGTEGQGIAGYGELYNLTQLSIPIGIGYRFNIWRKLAGAVEIGARRTFTDYLDDVSTAYVDPVLLANENGPLAAELADRSLSALGPDGSNTGLNRGESNRKDWYHIAGFMLTYKLGTPKIKCPSAFN